MFLETVLPIEAYKIYKISMENVSKVFVQLKSFILETLTFLFDKISLISEVPSFSSVHLIGRSRKHKISHKFHSTRHFVIAFLKKKLR